MYYDDEVIGYLQDNKILALQFDRVLTGTGEMVADSIDTLEAGLTRALYYTSCFTEEYQDVCKQQHNEDLRFRNSVIYIIKHGNVIIEMFEIYFYEILKYKTNDQLEHIKHQLMAVNIHIAGSTLTREGFAMGVAFSVAAGMKMSLEMSAKPGRWAGRVLGVVGVYGIVQKAADSANRLQYQHPAFYAALYARELEMMYFLIEPLFDQAGAFKQPSSNEDIANIISRMIQ
ncbi:hypothetical protein [Enterobacter sp. Bisph1]|uniref:hypothetical protein n=1 Tax=Enterobacter sp. Bisph1 TaxID=1274399 RepID=UPI00057C1681|nr:hypothetical protein [Enterobacter sp. Bisph1]